ncbi:hypothetical protein [Parvularcula sp. LCG005]|uniref:hypothetical protein n=1 Tax=Parvularcula sp. LCG005 TaxID=3078805 RepID=UPI002943DB58|nr:hypothetical protein [Parvularcula sp. LCG005]WOI52469.1 hypothetical protein RUI03_09955 [Parvularcula sp. LCG005]
MTKLKLLCAGAVLALLPACGGNDDTEAEKAADAAQAAQEERRIEVDMAASPASVPARTASVADTLGGFEGEVSGLAFWQHPTVPFMSAILAANGDAGLFVVPLSEDGTASQVEGLFNGGVAVSYLPGGSIAAAYEGGSGDVQIFAISPADRTLTLLGAVEAANGAKALCFLGRDLLRIDESGRQHAIRLTIEDDSVTGTTAPMAGPSAKGCTSTGKAIYVLAENGNVQKANIGDQTGSAEVPPSNPAAISIAALPTTKGPVFLSLLPDGTLQVGRDAIPVTGFADDRAAVLSQAITVGPGNFGGVYRDGVVGVLTRKNELKLIPWLGIANATDSDASTISLMPQVTSEDSQSPQVAVPQIEVPSLPGSSPAE